MKTTGVQKETALSDHCVQHVILLQMNSSSSSHSLRSISRKTVRWRSITIRGLILHIFNSLMTFHYPLGQTNTPRFLPLSLLVHYHPFRLRGQKSHVRIFPSRGYFVKFGLFNNCFCFSLLSHMYCLPYVCVDGITILQLVRFLLQYEKL